MNKSSIAAKIESHVDGYFDQKGITCPTEEAMFMFLCTTLYNTPYLKSASAKFISNSHRYEIKDNVGNRLHLALGGRLTKNNGEPAAFSDIDILDEAALREIEVAIVVILGGR